MIAPPVGDPSRDAANALHGYLYQIYATGIAWACLRPDELLAIEVAEDYAIAAQDALKAVQVKAKSSPITTSSTDVIQTIDSLFQLKKANPDRSIRLLFLTTAPIGREQRTQDRIEGKPALAYWKEVQLGADIAPLRQRLQAMPLGEAAKSFLKHADNDELRDELVRCIDWCCDAPSRTEQEKLLREILIYHGEQRGTDAHTSTSTIGPLIVELLERASGPSDARYLRRADFLVLFDEITRVSLSKNAFDALVASVPGGTSPGGLVPPSPIQSVVGPVAGEIANRHQIESAVDSGLRDGSAIWLTGGAGHGKTTIAQRCMERFPGDWRIASLRNLASDAIVNALHRCTAVINVEHPVGMIIDDLDHLTTPSVESSLRLVIEEARRENINVIVTTAIVPSRRLIRQLGGHIVPINVGDLSEEEVATIIVALGGHSETWSRYVHLGSGGGHPQLTHALAIGLSERGWPADELHQLSAVLGTNDDINAERELIRRRLVIDLPEPARRLLYRLSVLLGPYERQLAMTLAAVEPAIAAPGEALDRLLGPWVDRMPPDVLRTSSLVGNASTEMLDETERKAVHHAAAMWLTRINRIDADRILAIWTHSCIGEAPEPLSKFVIATLRTQVEDLPRLAEVAGLFARLSETPSLYPPNSVLAANLRIVQVLLAGALGDEKNFVRALERLEEEWMALHGDDQGYYGFLGKLLFVPEAVEAIPDLAGFCLRVHEAWEEISFDREALNQSLPDGYGPVVHPIARLFERQVSSVRSMGTLERVVTSLEGIDAKEREMLLAGFDGPPEYRALAIREPWMRLARAKEPIPLDLADRYRDLGLRFVKLEAADLAFDAFETASVIYSEEYTDHKEADNTLTLAARHIGHSNRLRRIHAKLAYHRLDYPRQLEIAAEVDPSELGTVGAAFFARETALAAAHLGQHALAAKYFLSGRASALASEGLSMRAMATGFQAHAAIEFFQEGQREEAIEHLLIALQEADALNPDGGPEIVLLRRVLGATLIWFASKCDPLGIGFSNMPEAAPMVPGMNSNPNKDPGLADLPTGPFEVCFYLFCDLAQVSPKARELWLKLRESSWDTRALLDMEVAGVRMQVLSAIFTLDHQHFARVIAMMVDTIIWQEMGATNTSRREDLFRVRGRVPNAPTDRFDAERRRVLQLVLLMDLSIAIKGPRDDLNSFRSNLHAGDRSVLDPEVIDAIDGVWNTSENSTVRVALLFGQLAAFASNGTPIDAVDLFSASYHVFNACQNTGTGSIADRFVGCLLKAWQDVVTNRAFMIQSPTLARQVVEDLRISERRGMPRLAELVLRMEMFVKVQLSLTLREDLRRTLED